MTVVALEIAVATRCVEGAMVVSDDVGRQLCKRRSSLGMNISLTATLHNLIWRDRNIACTIQRAFLS
jgi:predicted DNA repair protein MutK